MKKTLLEIVQEAANDLYGYDIKVENVEGDDEQVSFTTTLDENVDEEVHWVIRRVGTINDVDIVSMTVNDSADHVEAKGNLIAAIIYAA